MSLEKQVGFDVRAFELVFGNAEGDQMGKCLIENVLVVSDRKACKLLSI